MWETPVKYKLRKREESRLMQFIIGALETNVVVIEAESWRKR